MKPIIGITTEKIINKNEPWNAFVYGQKHTYSEAILAAGGIPLLIPFLPEAELKQLYSRLDGVLFSGGNDLSPTMYGEVQNEKTVGVTPERDRVESLLMRWALADNKPLFAICRGFQLFNAHLGGTLYQDLATEYEGALNHELSTHKQDYTHIAHTLKVDSASKLAAISKSLELKANTHHHQGVKDIAPILKASAWAEDGLVEALEHPGKTFALGVQCHPESLFSHDKAWANILNAFIDAASRQVIPKRLFRLKRRSKIAKVPRFSKTRR